MIFRKTKTDDSKSKETSSVGVALTFVATCLACAFIMVKAPDSLRKGNLEMAWSGVVATFLAFLIPNLLLYYVKGARLAKFVGGLGVFVLSFLLMDQEVFDNIKKTDFRIFRGYRCDEKNINPVAKNATKSGYDNFVEKVKNDKADAASPELKKCKKGFEPDEGVDRQKIELCQKQDESFAGYVSRMFNKSMSRYADGWGPVYIKAGFERLALAMGRPRDVVGLFLRPLLSEARSGSFIFMDKNFPPEHLVTIRIAASSLFVRPERPTSLLGFDAWDTSRKSNSFEDFFKKISEIDLVGGFLDAAKDREFQLKQNVTLTISSLDPCGEDFVKSRLIQDAIKRNWKDKGENESLLDYVEKRRAIALSAENATINDNKIGRSFEIAKINNEHDAMKTSLEKKYRVDIFCLRSKKSSPSIATNESTAESTPDSFHTEVRKKSVSLDWWEISNESELNNPKGLLSSERLAFEMLDNSQIKEYCRRNVASPSCIDAHSKDPSWNQQGKPDLIEAIDSMDYQVSDSLLLSYIWLSDRVNVFKLKGKAEDAKWQTVGWIQSFKDLRNGFQTTLWSKKPPTKKQKCKEIAPANGVNTKPS